MAVRLRSLDVARGVAVGIMVLVNNPGDAAAGPAALRHAAWHGVTFADLVFPAFVFMVGASLAFGRPSVARIVRRGVVLVLFGLVVNAALARSADLGSLRFTGVLQRIALVHVAAALLARRWRPPVWLAIAVGLLAVHWLLLRSAPLQPADNLSRTVDLRLLSPRHLYRGGPTDPEGLLGTISATATAVLGLVAGTWLRAARANPGRAAVGLAGLGTLAIVAARFWAEVLPFNKRLWTPSYALLTAGVAAVVLAACHLLDRPGRGSTRLAPAEALGRNAIVVYVGSEVLARATHDRVWPVVADLAAASVFYACVVTLAWALVAFALHHRRWYLAV